MWAPLGGPGTQQAWGCGPCRPYGQSPALTRGASLERMSGHRPCSTSPGPCSRAPGSVPSTEREPGENAALARKHELQKKHPRRAGLLLARVGGSKAGCQLPRLCLCPGVSGSFMLS